MQKPTTLYLKRNANVVKSKSSHIAGHIPDSTFPRTKQTVNMLKPFIHKDKSSGLYLYLGKKIKIFLGDL